MYGIEIPKQRGIYSEILTTEDTDNIRQVSTYGPQNKNAQLTVNKVQSKPRALGKSHTHPPHFSYHLNPWTKVSILAKTPANYLNMPRFPPILKRIYTS